MNGDLITAVFGNHLIRKSIFTNISSVEDLKRVRLVSTTWKAESLNHWRRTATLHLDWVVVLGAGPEKSQRITQDEFLGLWLRSTELGQACPYQLAKTPFSRYRIDNCVLLHVGSVECNKLERFLNVFGPRMKYLNLNQSSILPEQYGAVLKWILCKKVGSLEEFEVSLPRKVPPMISAQQLFWAELDASSQAPVSMLRKMTVELSTVFGYDDSIPRTHISISGTFLNENGFPHLAHLCLKGERVISFKGLRTLTNLQILRIESNPRIHDWNQRIGNEDEEEHLFWGNLVHIYVDYFRFTPRSLGIFGRWMPNLRRLELKFNARTRAMVPQLWPNIEEVNDLIPGNANGSG